MNCLYQINLRNGDISRVADSAIKPRYPNFDEIKGEVVWWEGKNNTIMKTSLDKANEKAIKGKKEFHEILIIL
mgnify:CR=1 FL=1